MKTELIPSLRHRRRHRLKITGGLIGLIALLGAALFQATPPTITQTVLDAQPGLAHVTRVVDGDTMDIELGGHKDTVRFLGIDTPETHDPRKPVQCFGQAAAAHTKALLEDKNVRLEPDPTNSNRDKYHRLLRYVYLPDGTLVNAEIIRDGYAFAYTVFPLVRLDEFRALETEARSANRGLWAGCNINESDKIKQTTSSK
ncbi:MAG TPA: thermonuclease family protein [Candidatus Saccharimonadia bacterium]|nr:thermonuclease family protein [Candidatus Saccharimonadia bacterium]